MLISSVFWARSLGSSKIWSEHGFANTLVDNDMSRWGNTIYGLPTAPCDHRSQVLPVASHTFVREMRRTECGVVMDCIGETKERQISLRKQESGEKTEA